uniref:Uncharacterized protein n=1 Tax=Romanomermis culicivorax TaxID=13658 RepID=A0A915IA77_ROMCU
MGVLLNESEFHELGRSDQTNFVLTTLDCALYSRKLNSQKRVIVAGSYFHQKWSSGQENTGDNPLIACDQSTEKCQLVGFSHSSTENGKDDNSEECFFTIASFSLWGSTSMQMSALLVIQFVDLHGHFLMQLAINRVPNTSMQTPLAGAYARLNDSKNSTREDVVYDTFS